MPPPLLLQIKDAHVRYTETPVFENLSFNVHEGTRIALVGKNGAGKTTLMNIITGTQDMMEGDRWEAPGLTVGYLKQDIIPLEGVRVFDYIFEEIKDEDKELYAYKVDIVTEALQIDPKAYMTTLSGGQLRRAGLARALVEEPDILLLDEPTNHLDLDVIEWLEGYLNSYRGTLLVISHDRTFLSNITNQVFWLDRGRLRVSPRGFKYFEEWSEELLEQEARELKNRKQAVGLEVAWASRGVKARVKRNVRRLEQVKEMRAQLEADEAAYRRATQKINIKAPKEVDQHSKVVAEFYNVHKNFTNEDGGTISILNKFSTRIQRGERIGIIGKNGSGKTTFLKLLIGELEADQGRVKVRKELEFSYFDQKRSDLDPTDSLKKVLSPTGNDYINVMGKERHVCGYLKDFMFDPSRAQDKVSQLSGGQKNRLMLARILANPKSCLILDEPTNDLDMDTLDMLEEILSNYKGTLIVVSHDRDFLDQTVTKIMAFEGDGKVEIQIGGYSDYLAKKQAQSEQKPTHKKTEPQKKTNKADSKTSHNQNNEPATYTAPGPAKKTRTRLTYKLEHEYKKLPEKIKKVEQEISALNNQLADPDFYSRDADGFHEAVKALEEAKLKLDRYETRWLELEDMKTA
ncbi:MAG: ABC transporter family protein [Micavibrio sp.]|nr:ABC transporter family protein [Micavibrio sp.]|tara:strand:+ start:8130 stop:10022 length:1893 start_codon:yes stop_codon:yes gene_type:complete